MASQVPAAIHAQKYVSLTTFRKTGAAVPTPVWFGEQDGKLYVMTRSDLGKTKRIRNNPQVKVALCTMRGKVTGPEFAAKARILPPEERGELLEIPIEIAVSAEIRQLVDLLARVEGAQKLLTVKDLRVRVVNVSQPKELLATLTISGFILPSKAKA